jgi:CheY-like chemotaxis protein
LEYVKSDDFKTAKACIIDVDLGYGIRVSGFNVIYNILRNFPTIPIIVCTSYASDDTVKHKANIIGATLIDKPIKPGLAHTIEVLITEKSKLSISDFEQELREFITGSQFLKSMLVSDKSTPVEYINKIIEIEEEETNILYKLSMLTEKRASGDDNTRTKSVIETFGQELKSYISDFVKIIDDTLYQELNLPTSVMQLVTDIIASAEKVLEAIDKNYA